MDCALGCGEAVERARRAADGRRAGLRHLRPAPQDEPPRPADHDLRGVLHRAPGSALRRQQGPAPRLLLTTGARALAADRPRWYEGIAQDLPVPVANLVWLAGDGESGDVVA